MSTETIPVEIADPINSRILEVAEDKLKGFQEDPLGEIARQTDLDQTGPHHRVKVTGLAQKFQVGPIF